MKGLIFQAKYSLYIEGFQMGDDLIIFVFK